MADLLLSPAEIEQVSGGYKRAHEQLKALHERGFHRAFRNRLGQVVLERAHYDEVSRRGAAANDPSTGRPRPVLRSLRR